MATLAEPPGQRDEAPKPGGNQETNMLLNLGRSQAENNTEALFSAPSTPAVKRAAAWLASRVERSKHMRADELESEVVQVTPELAEMMLERNQDNRPLRPRKVQLWSSMLTEGRWKLHHQGLAFSRTGKLLDGQHRLAAIAATGVAASMQVTFGVEDAAFDVLDTGANRSGADALAIAGYKYWTSLAAAARVFKNVTSNAPLGSTGVSNDECLNIVKAHPGLYEQCTDGHAMAKALVIPSSATICALYLISAQSVNPERLPDFIEQMTNGTDLRRGNPVLAFRNMCVARRFHDNLNAGNRASRVAATIILTWNKWCAGKTASEPRLRWNGTTEFPAAE